MCRLPLDIMRQIIEMVKQPILSPDEPHVTWKDLHQADLVSLMRASRMTYFIAAPLLYSEVVVNNLSSFFLGIDNRRRAHHDFRYVPPPDQRYICQWIKKSDGAAYCCPGHTPSPFLVKSTGEQALLALESPQAACVIGTYHKMELLKMVKAVHFVYGTHDKTILGDVNVEDCYDGKKLDLDILNKLDLRRYRDLPPCLLGQRNTSKVLPNLRRFTIANWLSTHNWDVNTLRQTNDPQWEHLDRWRAMSVLQDHIADIFPGFAATFACRHASSGFLDHYSHLQYIPDVNTLHEADLFAFGQHLVEATRNVIHIEQWDESETPLVLFNKLMCVIIDELSYAIKGWTKLYAGERSDLLQDTYFTFVLHRDWEYSWDIPTAEESAEDKMTLEVLAQDFQAQFEAELNPDGDESLDIWKKSWKIIWQDDHPGCPACRLDDFGLEDV